MEPIYNLDDQRFREYVAEEGFNAGYDPDKQDRLRAAELTNPSPETLTVLYFAYLLQRINAADGLYYWEWAGTTPADLTLARELREEYDRLTILALRRGYRFDGRHRVLPPVPALPF